MKKDCVISKIEASQDGSPYVYVTFTDPNDYKAGAERQQNPFGANMTAFTSPEDLMKNLPNAMGNISKAMGGGGSLSDSPTGRCFKFYIVFCLSRGRIFVSGYFNRDRVNYYLVILNLLLYHRSCYFYFLLAKARYFPSIFPQSLRTEFVFYMNALPQIRVGCSIRPLLHAVAIPGEYDPEAATESGFCTYSKRL